MLIRNRTFLIILALCMTVLTLFVTLSLLYNTVYNAGFWCGLIFTILSLLFVFFILTSLFVINRDSLQKVIIIPVVLSSIIYSSLQLAIGTIAVIQNSKSINVLLVIQIVIFITYAFVLFGIKKYQNRYTRASSENNYKKRIQQLTNEIIIKVKDKDIVDALTKFKQEAKYIDVEESNVKQQYYEEVIQILAELDSQCKTKENGALNSANRLLELVQIIKI